MAYPINMNISKYGSYGKKSEVQRGARVYLVSHVLENSGFPEDELEALVSGPVV